MISLNDNLMDCYMNYKASRLKKYGLVIMHSHDEFLEEVLEKYIWTYINCYYYKIFDTSRVENSSDDVIKVELEGKRLEMLDELSIYELIDSNEVFELKRDFINDSLMVVLFLITLDRTRFDSNMDISKKLNELLNLCLEIKERLGTKVLRLENLLKETYNTLNNFFKKTDNYYLLDYQLYKDQESLVKVVLVPNIKVLQDNYKKSLVERVYRDDKIKRQKVELLIKKFIKQLIMDVYYGKKIYQKYFIELDDDLFDNKKEVLNLLDMLDNPFIKRYVVLGISHNSYISMQSMFKKYGFTLACIQDFSHINDVSNKLNNIDTWNIYNYVVVSLYKTKDLDVIMKYSCVNLEGILFNKEEQYGYFCEIFI